MKTLLALAAMVVAVSAGDTGLEQKARAGGGFNVAIGFGNGGGIAFGNGFNRFGRFGRFGPGFGRGFHPGFNRFGHGGFGRPVFGRPVYGRPVWGGYPVYRHRPVYHPGYFRPRVPYYRRW